VELWSGVVANLLSWLVLRVVSLWYCKAEKQDSMELPLKMPLIWYRLNDCGKKRS
jgi:hypothetical protein